MDNDTADAEDSVAPDAPGHPSLLAGSLAGAAGAGVAIGVGELVEGASESIPSLVVAVGELVTDYTPGDVVAASIANLGSNQKTLLTAGIVIVTVLFGAGLGRLIARGRTEFAVAGFAVLGLIAGWATARNPFSPAVGSWLVALAASGLGVATTLLLARSAVARQTAPHTIAGTSMADDLIVPEELAWDDSVTHRTDEPVEQAVKPVEHAEASVEHAVEHAMDGRGRTPERVGTRRSFFAYTAGAAATALGMVGVGRSLRGPSAAELARESIVIPTATTVPAVTTAPRPNDPNTSADPDAPATTQPPTDTAPAADSVRGQLANLDTFDGDVNGISSYITPNNRFYRIDTALSTPQVDPANWKLRFTGMVDNPYEITFDEILAMDLSEHVITLACVSNPVGGDLVGNAVWTGVPLAALLERAGVQQGASQVVGRSVDDWTAGFPTDVVFDGRNAILAVGMNGEALPTRHGFPARLVVAGLYGYVSAVKWIEEIRMTTWEGFDGYWVPRGWSKEGPMKTQSRIDVPASARGLSVGEPASIAGIAWAPTRGVQAVEVRINEGEWMPCDLADALGDESWVQWHLPWTPSQGRNKIQVRATDGDGIAQSGRPVGSRPNGAEGWHTRTVTVNT